VVDNWIAPPLTEANPSPVPWTQEQLFRYLRTGVDPLHGAVAATMTSTVRDALDLPVVPDDDVRAIALYMSDIDRAGTRESNVDAATKEALQNSSLGSGQNFDPDADLNASACLSCHYNSGAVPLAARPELALTVRSPCQRSCAQLPGSWSLRKSEDYTTAILSAVGHTF
jgi:hypothetical protein